MGIALWEKEVEREIENVLVVSRWHFGIYPCAIKSNANGKLESCIIIPLYIMLLRQTKWKKLKYLFTVFTKAGFLFLCRFLGFTLNPKIIIYVFWMNRVHWARKYFWWIEQKEKGGSLVYTEAKYQIFNFMIYLFSLNARYIRLSSYLLAVWCSMFSSQLYPWQRMVWMPKLLK